MSAQKQAFGLKSAEVQIILQLSNVIAEKLQNEVEWLKIEGDLSRAKQLEYAFSALGFTYYTYFEQRYVNADLGEIRDAEQISKDYERSLSALSRLEKSLVQSLSQPIARVIVQKAHENQRLNSVNDFLSIISNYISSFYKNTSIDLKKLNIDDYLQNIALDVIVMLRYYVSENTEGKKRGKYRKKSELPHPDLPSNHYLNLQSVSLGIRAAPDLKAAIDAAVAQSPIKQSRNDWVKSAIEEKLLRENPDLLADPSHGGD